MKKNIRILIIIYLIIVLLKIIIATQVPSPSIFSDEYVYAKMARSFYTDFKFSLHQTPTNTYPPLYPILLSITYLFTKDMIKIFLIMKILNSLVSSLIIIPAFLISKDILDNKNTIIATILIGIHSTFFNFSNYLMGENLYYPLFLISIYYLLKTLKDNSYKNNMFLGIFTGLTILTKMLGLALVSIVFLTLLYTIFIQKNFKHIETKIVAGFVALMIMLPWIIRSKILFGTFNMLGNYVRETTNLIKPNLVQSSVIFTNWFVIYVCYLAISSGIILFIFNFTNIRERFKNNFFIISLITGFIILVIASNHNVNTLIKQTTLIPWFSGRVIGRYIDIVTPLIIINGLNGLNKRTEIKKHLYYLIPIFIIGSQLTFFQLFPVNNISLAPIGIIKYIIEFLLFNKTSFVATFNILTYIIMLLIFLFIPILINKIFKTKKTSTIIKLLFIFFIVNLTIGSTIIIYNSKNNWHFNDQIQTGLWVNENLKDVNKITIDKKYCGKEIKEDLCSEFGAPSLVSFFINKDIDFDGKKEGTFITKEILEYPKLYEKNKIYIYQIEMKKP